MRDNTANSLNVTMFGKFSVEGRGGYLGEDTIRSDMLTRLLVYIFCHRGQEMSIQDICDTLWAEDNSDNPAGALKNLMYRLRSRLKAVWGDQAFILTGHGSYQWNPEIPVVLDAEQFDALVEKAQATDNADKKITCLGQAMDLYKGTFLPKLTGEHWIVSQTTYYHSEYLNAARELVDLLDAKGEYEAVAERCRAVLTLDALDEGIHTAFIKALMEQGKSKLAMEQYKKAEDILYENLGVKPSKELRDIYEELLKQTHSQEMDLAAIEHELREDSQPGAFLCEYGVFKKTYHLELRRASRLGVSVYIALITVIPSVNIQMDSPAYLNIINTGMDRLENILLTRLRSGDVISRYSGSQFIVLLPTCQYETAKMVMERIRTAYFDTKKKSKVRLSYSLQEMISAPAASL
jgi:DNA-binding SARP family transcriptional activator